MTLNVDKEVAALDRMTVSELRSKHLEAFGEPARSGNKDWLRKRVAWRLQANAYGDLSCRARRRAEELANDADLRTTAPKVKPLQNEGWVTVQTAIPFAHGARLPLAGGTLTRTYKGRDIVVYVRPKGFEFDGVIYRSLSAVAESIKNTHWNGYHFFNLKRNGGDDE